MATVAETRIFTWYVDESSNQSQTFIADRDYRPEAVRVHARIAPDAGDMEFDILDDGVSIFGTRKINSNTISRTPAEIGLNGESSTSPLFTLGETVTGGTSSATAIVNVELPGHLTVRVISGVFSVNETITGGTSGSTANVTYFLAAQEKTNTVNETVKDLPTLRKGNNSEEVAEDFGPAASTIEKYSLLTLSLPTNSGKGITVQLELVAEEDDEVAQGDT